MAKAKKAEKPPALTATATVRDAEGTVRATATPKASGTGYRVRAAIRDADGRRWNAAGELEQLTLPGLESAARELRAEARRGPPLPPRPPARKCLVREGDEGASAPAATAPAREKRGAKSSKPTPPSKKTRKPIDVRAVFAAAFKNDDLKTVTVDKLGQILFQTDQGSTLLVANVRRAESLVAGHWAFSRHGRNYAEHGGGMRALLKGSGPISAAVVDDGENWRLDLSVPGAAVQLFQRMPLGDAPGLRTDLPAPPPLLGWEGNGELGAWLARHASADEGRENLRRVEVLRKGAEVSALATDGHRLACVSTGERLFQDDEAVSVAAQIPRPLGIRVGLPVSASDRDPSALIGSSSGDRLFCGCLEPKEFPKLQNVIPDDRTWWPIEDPAEIAAALRDFVRKAKTRPELNKFLPVKLGLTSGGRLAVASGVKAVDAAHKDTPELAAWADLDFATGDIVDEHGIVYVNALYLLDVFDCPAPIRWYGRRNHPPTEPDADETREEQRERRQKQLQLDPQLFSAAPARPSKTGNLRGAWVIVMPVHA